MKFISLDDLKAQLLIEPSDHYEDAKLTELAETANEVVLEYLSRPVFATQEELIASGEENGIVSNLMMKRAALVVATQLNDNPNFINEANWNKSLKALIGRYVFAPVG